MKKLIYLISLFFIPLISLSQTNWNGTSDADWQNASNWTTGIPDASDNVTILNSASFFPIIDDGATVALTADLTIESGASVTIASNGRLTVGGTLTNNAGTSGIVIQSDVGGTGSLIFSTGSVNGTVNLFLEGTKWHYVSAPVDGVDYSEFNTLNFKYWDESQEWAGGTNTDPWSDYTTTLVNGQGYANYESENTIELTGTLHQGTYNIPVTRSSSDGNQGWNLIGNPYNCAIDWESVKTSNVNVADAIYFFDGIYYSYVDGISDGTATQYIPQGQGFFVKCTDVAGGSISLNNDDRVHNSQSFFKNSKETSGLIQLIIQGNAENSKTTIRFKEGATDEFDESMDAYKILTPSSPIPQIYSLNSSKTDMFSINTLPEITGEITIPIGLYIETSGTYSISPFEMSIDAQYVYIEDTEASEIIDLIQYPTYLFDYTGDVSPNDTRFTLRIVPNSTNIERTGDNKILMYPNPSQGIVNFITDFNSDDNGSIEIFSLSGKKILSKEISSGSTKNLVDLSSFPNGIYNVNINYDDKIVNKKLILMKQ